MTNQEQLLALATRCEEAVGPDRELDAQIYEALGYEVTRDHRRMGYAQRGFGPLLYADCENWSCLRSFTRSLDAAATLVPKDKIATIGAGLSAGMAVIADEDGDNCVVGKAATPALALCAAALRARAGEPS